MANGHGGARAGAGRPKLFASKLNAELVRIAEEKAPQLAAVLMDKALTGDVPAIKEMMDRAVGKALQNVDMTTNGKDLPSPIIPLHAIQRDDSAAENPDAEKAA